MTYELIFERDASRALERLPEAMKTRVLVAVDALRTNPRPSGVVKLKGFRNRWRVRVGSYRVIYEVYDERLVVVVLDVAHRSKAY